jgi:hypothetical protein
MRFDYRAASLLGRAGGRHWRTAGFGSRAAGFGGWALSFDDRALGGRNWAQSWLDRTLSHDLQSLRGSRLRSGLKIGQDRLECGIKRPRFGGRLSTSSDANCEEQCCKEARKNSPSTARARHTRLLSAFTDMFSKLSAEYGLK